MATERDRFVADLIAALQANEEFATSGRSAAAQSALGRPTTAAVSQAAASVARGARAPRGVLPPSAFADSDESDDSSRGSSSGADVDADATDDIQHMFTGLFHERWQSLSSSAAPETPQQQLALEAYEKLQFDYPQVPDAQLLALAESYRQVATAATNSSSSTSSVSVAAIPVSNTLVDGIVYLTEKSSETAPSDARSVLAASVLLVLFESCLRNADHVRARTVLSKLHAPAAPGTPDAPVDWSSAGLVDPLAQVPPRDDGEKYAAEEDPDDLSAVYEGDVPSRRPSGHGTCVAPSRTHRPSATPFAAKLQLLASRTFSSAFVGVSAETWSAWALDRTLVAIIELLLLRAPSQPSAAQQLYGHPHGEWTRYLYILRDRILRAPSASRAGIRALCDLVERLAPLHRDDALSCRVSRSDDASGGLDSAAVDWAPHHLVYRVLAELVVSTELQQRAASAAQRELAAALETLLPRLVTEVERLSSLRRHRTDARVCAQDDDLFVILLQLVHFVLAAAPSKRVASERLQATGLLRALLTLVPAAPDADADAAVAQRWVAPLLRVLAECALWNRDVAAYVVRVPKVVALLPAMATHCRAECALLLVALYQHECHDSAALETWSKRLVEAHSASTSSSSSLWDVVVARALFPPSCPTYLDAMTQLHDAVYFLECIVDALASLRRELLAALRLSVQRVYGTLAHAFAYPAQRQSTDATATRALVSAASSAADPSAGAPDSDERGEAEALQFVALRNKLRQCVKTLLLQSNSSGGAGVRASSKLD